MVESSIGQVTGRVMAGGSLAPLAGWEVFLHQISGRSIALQGSTGIDGSFSFPGVPVGTFLISASKPGQGAAQAEGRIIREGDPVDIPLVVNLFQPAYGRIAGVVFTPGGAAAANTRVCLNSCPPGGTAVTTDADGAFAFESVPLGRFTLLAQSQTTQDSGSGKGEVVFAGDTAYVAIVLSGLGRVTGTAYYRDGSVAKHVDVTLYKAPDAGCGLPECTQSAIEGHFQFTQVPAGNFTVRIRDKVSNLSGSTGGTLNPAGVEEVEVFLEPTGDLTARALPDVLLPASLVILAGESQEVTLQISAPAPAGGLQVDLTSGNPGVATVTPPSVLFPQGETTQKIMVSGVAGGETAIATAIQGIARGSMPVTVKGGVVAGTVYNPSMNPVAGVQINVKGVLTTTQGDGSFQVDGVPGPEVAIKAFDPLTHLKGYATATMTAPNGFVRGIQVILTSAGAISGTVLLPDGQIPAGGGVKVDLLDVNDLPPPPDRLDRGQWPV